MCRMCSSTMLSSLLVASLKVMFHLWSALGAGSWFWMLLSMLLPDEWCHLFWYRWSTFHNPYVARPLCFLLCRQPFDRGIDSIDWNNTNRSIFWQVFVGWYITTTFGNSQLQFKGNWRFHGAKVQLRIHNLEDVVVGFDITGFETYPYRKW